MQCAMMNRRTLAMDWDGLGDDEDDHFFESWERASSAAPLDLPSSGSDEDDFEDSRMSFKSTTSSASFKSSKASSTMAAYDMWMAEPGDIRERRRRLLQGMGITSTKDMLRVASTKIAEAAPEVKIVESSPIKDEPPSSSSSPAVHIRSRSDGDIEALSSVKELMRRKNTDNSQDDKKLNHNSYFKKSFRNSKRKGASLLKNIKGVASSKSLSQKNHEHSSSEEQKEEKAPSQWVKSHQHGKSYKEFTALHMSQEIQAHEGSIWTIRFSYDAHLLASAGEDKVVHVWEVQECDVMSTRSMDDLSSISGTPVHQMAGISERSPLAEITPDRQVVDWTDVHEMVTAASYTPDGQFAPSNPSEVLITSTDSRIRIYNGPEQIQKFRGFRNTSSQISASFSPDGKHVISASEDSQVYVWKVAESKNSGGGKKKSQITVQAHEHFQCKDVSVAIAWPGSLKNEPPIVEIHSRRHSKRLTAPQPTSPTLDDNVIGTSSRRQLPPLPKKNNGSERIDSSGDEDWGHSSRTDPGIGVTDSFRSSSGNLSYRDSPSISASSPSQSWSSRSFVDNGSGQGAHTVQATAWGMVIVTASLEGEIRVFQNFGLPRKVANLFRD